MYLAASHSGRPSLSLTSLATERWGRMTLSSRLDSSLMGNEPAGEVQKEEGGRGGGGRTGQGGGRT